MTFFVSLHALRTLTRKLINPPEPLPVPAPDPFFEAMDAFDGRITYARRHHQPVRYIERERQAFTHGALRG